MSDPVPAAVHDIATAKAFYKELDSKVDSPTIMLLDTGYIGLEQWKERKFSEGKVTPFSKQKKAEDDSYIRINQQIEEKRGKIEKFFGNLGNLFAACKEKRFFFVFSSFFQNIF